MKKHMIVGMLLTFSFYFMVAPPLLIHAADVTLTVGNGSGFPGSPDNVVEVSLDNPSDIVKGLQVDIGSHFTCTECTPNPDRAPQFYCFTSELNDGSCRVILFAFGFAEEIQIGNGPILSINYSIKENVPAEACTALHAGGVKVSGENNQSLDVVSVEGELCFLSCQVNGECNDENECTDDTCDAGQCVHECNATSPSESCCNNPVCVSDSVCINSSDTDLDGIPNIEDNCPDYWNDDQTNSDNDSYGDACDNCYATDNEDQADADSDSIGDACDKDIPCGDVWAPESSSGAMDCGDGEVDIYDIVAEADIAIGIQPDACQLTRADVPTGTPPHCSPPDGTINILDVVVIVDRTLGRVNCCRYFECITNEDCDDGLYCSGTEICDAGSAVCQQGNEPCFDDGLFCNGTESCNELNDQCESDGNPCPTDTNCNEDTDTCDPILTAASVPTLSEWGLIIFMTIIIGIGVMTLVRRRMV